jgi:transcription factor SPN1
LDISIPFSFHAIDLQGLVCFFRFRDEDGEPLMDYDGVQSDREQSPEPRQGFLDDDDEGEWQRERSETPVYDAEASSMKAKPRKRLIKKSDPASAKEIVTPNLVDEDEDEDEDEEDFETNPKKWKEGKSGGKKEKRHKGEKRGFSSSGKSDYGRSSKRGGFSSGKDRDGEVKEMWDTIAGNDSEV